MSGGDPGLVFSLRGGLELDQTLELPFVLRATRQALAQATPVIWNSDQGSHFTSPQYIGLLEEAEVQISRDGTGRALDTVFTERLWRTAKYEEVYLSSNLRLTAFDSTINNKGSRSTLDMPARLS